MEMYFACPEGKVCSLATSSPHKDRTPVTSPFHCREFFPISHADSFGEDCVFSEKMIFYKM
jgi:hypothetical protein